MTKQEAKDLFGSTRALCAALNLKPHTFYRWPDELHQKQTDWVIGAYQRIAEERDRKVVHIIGGA